MIEKGAQFVSLDEQVVFCMLQWWGSGIVLGAPTLPRSTRIQVTEDQSPGATAVYCAPSGYLGFFFRYFGWRHAPKLLLGGHYFFGIPVKTLATNFERQDRDIGQR